MAGILWLLAAVVVVVWLLGFIFDVIGNFIHILLILAAILIVWNLLSRRRTA